MIPLKIRRLFCGFGPGRFMGIRGLIFAHCSSLNQNMFALIGWPPNRLTNLLNIKMVNKVLTLAVWEYCEASVAYIFGNALGDPIADEILRALQQAGSDGMTRTAIRDLFGRHQSGERIGAALQLLATKGRARRGDKTLTGGRPPETWFAVVR